MKKFLMSAVGIAIAFVIAYMPVQLLAQVNGEFTDIKLIEGQPFVALTNATELPNTMFALPPNFTPEDSDDGYGIIDLRNSGHNFRFEFNGEKVTEIYVSVNGFLTFKRPPNLPAKNPKALFWDANNFPVNIIAPFWGDHFYRDDEDFFQNGYVQSKLLWKIDTLATTQRVLTIEWRNLNINWRLGADSLKASVATFQVKLYESMDLYTMQGDIEFCYNVIGNNPNVSDTRVATKGASIGLKGEGKIVGEGADFLNGLRYGYSTDIAGKDSTTLSVQWPPSGGTDKRIRFSAIGRASAIGVWGDGDVDFSKAFGNKHYTMAQNRFVTVNDARIIMKAVAYEKPLDSVRRRAAFYGDVNHNGRFYYNNSLQRISIKKRSKHETDDLPNEVASIKQIFYEANEADAAVILAYISARVPFLPWVLDTIPRIGKLGNASIAENIKIGTITKLNNTEYLVPVYLDNNFDGSIGTKFNVSGEVIDVISNSNDDNSILVNFAPNTVVISGHGKFSSTEPIAFVKVNNNNSTIELTNIRFNDNEIPNITGNVEVKYSENDRLMQNMPNPFNPATTQTLITVNINENSNYNLTIFDVYGNVVKTLVDGILTSGTYTYNWDGTDSYGNSVATGIYVYRLTDGNNTITRKMVIEK